MNYYNEFDPRAAGWLRNLIRDGLIPAGKVDERSIVDVRPSDLDGFRQCHFFAGIGGWSLALRLAGWPDDRPVWTGSAPCQPFSTAGRNKGAEDSRDLWPVFARLIAESKPSEILGEQVADAIRWGWLDRLCDDLEAQGYAIGQAVLPASAIGAIHARSRLWWAARAYTTREYGQSHDCLGKGRAGRASVESGRLPSLCVSGQWWSSPAGAERLPTLVRHFNGLSAILGGFGNAIVPQVAAAFIEAFMEGGAA